MKTMRTLGYSLLIFCGSLFIMTACGDDETEQLALIGSFSLSKESTSGCVDAADNVVETKTCTDANCETIIISGDGNFSITKIDNGITTVKGGTYTTNGNQITFTYTINSTDVDVATFSLSGSNLTVTYSQDTDGCVEEDVYTRS